MGTKVKFLTEAILRPDEAWAMLSMRSRTKQVCATTESKTANQPEWKFCYEMLTKVSRSFALVIQQLAEAEESKKLRDAVCVFYLVLRALDTIEDDMGIPIDEKVEMLESFYKEIDNENYTREYGLGDYRDLMKNFGKVSKAARGLSEEYKKEIVRITKKMGEGMAEFINKPKNKTEGGGRGGSVDKNDDRENYAVVTITEYDKYCFYVAGLVGIGLTNLFVVSKVEKDLSNREDLTQKKDLIEDMGLFLQKTNIIRDYKEDIEESPPRMFWPKEIWGKHAEDLNEFKENKNREKAISCLNDMIVDSLRHAEGSLKYLSLLENAAVIQFCAIPQVMAIATLALCYNNGKVFETNVKIRRGQSCKIFLQCQDMRGIYSAFHRYAGELKSKANLNKDEKVAKHCDRLQEICKEQGVSEKAKMVDEELPWGTRLGLLFFSLGYAAYALNLGNVRESLGVAKFDSRNTSLDGLQAIIALLVLLGTTILVLSGRKL